MKCPKGVEKIKGRDIRINDKYRIRITDVTDPAGGSNKALSMTFPDKRGRTTLIRFEYGYTDDRHQMTPSKKLIFYMVIDWLMEKAVFKFSLTENDPFPLKPIIGEELIMKREYILTQNHFIRLLESQLTHRMELILWYFLQIKKR